MKQGRTPDRVHVVRPPENDHEGQSSMPATTGQNRAMEIIRTLAQISDKLKRSEAERYELLAELREYRKSLHELEDKADKSEKAYLALENKIKSSAVDPEILQRQARFERALKETESKLVQAAAGQSLLDKRLSDTEAYQAGVTQRLDETVMQQARLDRTLEKIGQDKTRVLRKVERMEEILTETQDTLKARALVLLTDQSSANSSPFPQIAAYKGEAANANADLPWWRQSVRLQGIGMAAMIVTALLFGWAINQVQQPEIPKIAVLENGGLARLNLENNTWEPVSAAAANAPIASQTPEADATLIEAEQNAVDALNRPAGETEQTPAADAAINASDEQLMKALEEDPEGLASQLNEIAPGASAELAAPAETAALPPASSSYNPLASSGAKAFAQDPQVANLITREKGNAPLNERIASDSTLPATLKDLEAQAYKGIPEAQHDLAAIYTAGRAGVTQNFDKAALWFREAADNGIANASYNLGVLYHQGLGVEKDLDRALYWYREAAKKGHPEAQYNLGISYIEGIGVDYNAPLAAAFFESSANQGIVEAAYNLGLIYENGLIGGANKQEDALMWYKIAADGGSTDAKGALAQLASSMGIADAEVNKLAEKMQGLYQSSKGRRAGPDGASKSVQKADPNREIVAQIQEILKNESIYNGPADGVTGPQTVDAIRQYQASHGMKVTGLATQDLLAAMLAGQ